MSGKIIPYERSFASHEKAKYWSKKNKENPRDVFKGTAKKFIFDCNICKKEFLISLNNITSLNRWCKDCGYNISKNKNSMKLNEFIEKAKEISNCIIVFENMQIGYNKTNLTLNTNDLIKTIETTSAPFIGLITETQLLFDSSNRIWHAHKLCGAKND